MAKSKTPAREMCYIDKKGTRHDAKIHNPILAEGDRSWPTSDARLDSVDLLMELTGCSEEVARTLV